MRRVSFLPGLFTICWIPEYIFSQSPLIDVTVSILMATVLIFLVSYSQFRIDGKYKQVTATTKDYFLSNVYLYLIALLPGLVSLGVYYFLPRLGILTLIYVDGVVLGILIFLARFPVALRLGQKAVRVTDGSLFSSFSVLASKMDIPQVDLYTIDWRRFKVANALQSGPRRFSVFISNFLLENMTTEEISAVMAHELAHALRKHVLKITTLLLCVIMVGLDSFIIALTLNQGSPWALIPIAAGFVAIFGGPQLALRLQRKFEFEADEIAVRTVGDGRPMVGALQKLMNLNLLPADKKSGTHPSIDKRIERIEGIRVK
jgi:STE24 endopeptidase